MAKRKKKRQAPKAVTKPAAAESRSMRGYLASRRVTAGY